MKKHLFSILAILGFTIGSIAQIPNYVPSNGLLGYWPFNGNANDESVNSNNGIVYPNTTLTQDRFNNSNNAYLFDNSVQSGIQTNTPLTYSTTGISGSLWFNTNVFLNSSAGHRQFISGTSSIPFQFAYNNGGVDLEVYNQFGGLTVFTWPSIFIPNSWHHVAFSVNTNGNVLISIDGQVYNAGSSPNSLRTANNSAYIFGLSSSAFWPNPFSGKLDDIAIWNRALSQEEITALYTGVPVAPTSCLPATVPINGLVGYWPFCGNANDESGNGNNGTVNGATLTSDKNGNANSAYSFNGISNVNISNSNIAAFLNGSFSFGAWFKTSSSLQGDIIRYDNCVTGSGWGLRIGYNNSGQIQGLEFDNSRNPNFVTSNNLYNNGNWHFAVFKRDISIMKDFLFVDNQLIAETMFFSVYNIELTGHPLFIGAGCDFFNGDLDDIGIWNRALSLQEIQQLYSGTSCVPPTANITAGGPTSFCSGGNVLLSAPSDTSYTYQWQLNGSGINSATSAAYSANASGDYSVIISNGASCSDTSAVTTVTVNPLPMATITAAGSTTFCAGANVVLNANSGTGLTYQWKLNGNNISGANSGSYTATAAGSYTVVVINTSTCSATSSATTVTVNPLPTATITAAGATTFCAGANVVLNANTGTGLSYQWKLNGNNISGATAASYTATAAGSYTVVVTNTSTCSATSSATTVTVNPLPAATITAAGSTTFCAGANLVLNANTGTGLSYQWKLNGNNISGATTPSYTASAAGSYTVLVTNTSTCSATSSATTVTVNPLPTATITAAGSTTFCAGANVVLNANSGTGLIYQWKLNGSNISGANSGSYTATAAGSYTVVVTNTSTCSATSSATTVTVNPLPTLTLTSLPAFVNIQTPSVALNGSPTGGLYSGQGISGTNFIPTLAGLGHAVVSYSYTSSAGCSGNVIKNTIVYDTTGTVCTSYDTIYTSINDTVLVSVQDTLIIETLILGSNPVQSNEIKVYPNPAHSFLEIDNGNFALMGGYTIRIENSLGQVVFNQAVNQQLFSINLSTWTGDGVYYLHIINSNGITQEIKKIVLQ